MEDCREHLQHILWWSDSTTRSEDYRTPQGLSTDFGILSGRPQENEENCLVTPDHLVENIVFGQTTEFVFALHNQATWQQIPRLNAHLS